MRMGASFLVSIVILFLAACNGEEQRRSVSIAANDCDAAQQRCEVTFDGLTASLALQQGLVPLKPFSIGARIEGDQEIEWVHLEFQMVGMEMGLNRYRLLEDGDGWRGEATLPVCTSARADWVAIMEFEHNARRYLVTFPFTTQ